MKILSINFNHDGAGVILDHGMISAFVNTERFSRNKKQPAIREEDLDALLTQARASITDIDFVILVNLGMNSPEIFDRFHTDFSEQRLQFQLSADRQKVQIRGHEIPCLVNPEHFLCHSSVAYYFSPFDSAVCFSYDPLGSGVYLGQGNRLQAVPHRQSYSGRLYNDVSVRQLNLGGIFGAGKTMALASYISQSAKPLVDGIVATVDKGRFYSEEGCAGLEKLVRNVALNVPQRYEDKWDVTPAYMVQALMERELAAILDETIGYCDRENIAKNLCLSGGAALNTVANQRCFAQSGYEDLYIHPACGDDGTAIGAALYYWHHVLDNPRQHHDNREAMYSVKQYDDSYAEALRDYAGAITVTASEDYIRLAAQQIAAGKIIGWFNGASEIGPRALGNRSILCSPAAAEFRDKLNYTIKKRESFRPFAPAVMEELSEAYFDVAYSPFMLRVATVKNATIPGVTHVDGTARVQTVRRDDNAPYYDLIRACYELTGIPVILNTSFNINGEPIVETPWHAIDTFLNSELDTLFLPGLMIERK